MATDPRNKTKGKLMINRLLTGLILLTSLVYADQNGRISGVITDADTHEPLAGANVVLEGTALGAATDVDGVYLITNVPVGTYQLKVMYIGYGEVSVPVDVTADQSTRTDVELKLQVFEGETVEVTAQLEGQARAINQQLSANTIVNVVSSDKIQELPDQNAAESLGRLPGIAVQRDAGEGQKIIIRGLAPKYNLITVNGERIPSTDPTDRSVDLSMISSEMLAGIEVYKALTPDKDGDAIGGTVNFVVKKAPEGLKGDFRIQGGYNDLVRDYGVYKATASISNRFLNNKLGILATGSIQRANRSSDAIDAGYTPEGVTSTGETIIKTLQLNLNDRLETRDRYGASLTLDYDIPDGNILLNSFWGRTDRDEILRRRRYNVEAWRSEYTMRDRQMQTDIWTNSLSGSHSFGDFLVDWSGAYSVSKLNMPFSHYARFFELGAFNADLEENKGPTYIPAGATNNLDDTFFKHSYFDQQSNTDQDLSAQLDLKYPFTLSTMFAGYIKFGGKYRSKSREVDNYEIWSNHFGINYLGAESPPGTWDLTSLDKVRISNFIDPGFKADNFLNGQYEFGLGLDVDKLNDFFYTYRNYILDDGTPLYIRNPLVDIDDYKAGEKIMAAYVMPEIKFGTLASFIPGFRYERTSNDYSSIYGTPRVSEDDQSIIGLTDTTGQSTREHFLPMFLLRVKPLDWFDVRLTATKSLSRPDYFSLVPYLKRDDDNRIIEEGNPELRSAVAWNYDVYLSFYNTYGLFTVGGFYKDIVDVSYTRTTTIKDGYWKNWKLTSPVNSEYNSTVKGFEIEIQTNLRLLPSPFDGIVFYANYSRIFSETFFPVERIIGRTGPPLFQPIYSDTVREGKMPGQTDHLLNFSIGYEKGGFSGRLSLFVQPKSLATIGEFEATDTYTSNYSRWDLAIQQKIGFGLSLYADFLNISNRPEGSYYGSEKFPLTQEYFGWYADFGIRYRF
jgi:TonB-dependent receptor